MTMTPKQLNETASLNIEFYRKAAKALLKAARAGDRDANDRLKAAGATGEIHVLHVAQLAIAREQGFASWPRFVAFITESNLDFQGLVTRFIDAATSDLHRARDILADHPELKGAGVYVALVMGEWQTVAQAIEADPDFATRPSGPDGVEPIVYTCFSRFGHHWAPEAADVALTLRLLLNHGADPNTAFASEDGPLSCLYAASGLLGNVEMTRLLLEAGADPDDGESLYHATEQPDLACLRLLLEHGANVTGSNAIKHILDQESPEGLRLLLDAGGDPNETNPEGDTALHWAVRRGRSSGIVTMLIEAGADIDAVRNDGRTAYALAVVSGQTAVARLLAAHGADTRLSTIDAFVSGEGGEVPKESAMSPENARLLTQLAESGNLRGVEALLKAGVPVDARGDGGNTALHYAAWRGNAPMIKLLLGHGAPLDVADNMYNATPAGYLHHGATNCGEGDYAESTRLLIAAGVREWTEPSGNPKMDAVLREHGIIAG
jgi:ankyrin repeat protein